MLQLIRQVFADENGDPSSLRVMAFEIVQVALAIALLEVWRQTLTLDSIGLVMGLLTLAFTGKVMQKKTEVAASEGAK